MGGGGSAESPEPPSDYGPDYYWDFSLLNMSCNQGKTL